MERIAIFPGSFDPFTRGHAALVDQALQLFDRVVVGIGVNTAKRGMLTAEQRCRLVQDAYSNEPRVECQTYSGLTGDLARTVGASAIIRGVRNTTDFEYERSIEAINRRIYPELVTVALYTPHSVADISSSAIRELVAYGCPVEELMPEGIDIKKYM